MNFLDIISSIEFGYKYTWANRKTILRLALPALILTIACAAVASFASSEASRLTLTLLFLPAFFAQGLMVSVLIRKALLGKQFIKVIPTTEKNLMAGMVSYVLMTLILSFIAWIAETIIMDSQPQITENLNPTILSIGLAAILAASFWSVRIGWIFIPISIGYSPVQYLSKLKGMFSSVIILAIWLGCSLPILGMATLLFTLIKDASQQTIAMVSYVLIPAADMATLIISSIAIAIWLGKVLYKSEQSNSNKKG